MDKAKGKTVARKPAAAKRRTAHNLTLTQEKARTKETIVLPFEPDSEFTFAGREHQLLISINQHGTGSDVGYYEVNDEGRVSCSICKSHRIIPPLYALMTDEAIAHTKQNGVGRFDIPPEEGKFS